MIRSALVFALVLCGTWFVFRAIGWDVPAFLIIGGQGIRLSTLVGIVAGIAAASR